MRDGHMPSYESADSLRKSGNYTAACEQFAEIWRQEARPRIGWRYAFCLRKTGRLEEAERIAKEALAKFPDDKYTKAEMGWVLYEKELKPAKKEADLPRVIQVANQILSLNTDRVALSKAVLTVMKVAKEQRNWAVALEWADRVVPEDLSGEPMMADGKRAMSDLETWFVGRARALFELRRFDEARQFALAGLAKIPDGIFLRRLAALSLARTGDLAGAITEMRDLITHHRADWYMKAELADLEYQARNYAEAYRLICDAVSSNRQPEEYKLRHFVTLARIALALGKLDVAAAHITWARLIRSTREWTITPELLEVEQDIHSAIRASNRTGPEIPKDTRELKMLCNRYWHEGKAEGAQFYRGTIKSYPKGRHFAYIQRDDGGEDVYVAVDDLPKNCVQPGSRIEFALKRSYDKKKERESVRATNVRCVAE